MGEIVFLQFIGLCSSTVGVEGHKFLNIERGGARDRCK